MNNKDNFTILVKNLEESLKKVSDKKLDLSSKIDFSDFKATESKYIIDKYKNSLNEIKGLIDGPDIPERINELLKGLDFNNIENNKKVISGLKVFKDVKIRPRNTTININKIPEEIRNEVKADLEEIKKCFDNGCYRSSVILCGRIIEVCLHAKYYKATGFDILDKNPGIGLGKLIAKMQEKNIKLDPGLTQQIHLVNNVRIFSVHKKQRTFIPAMAQTEAIILYTTDVINHLF